MADTFDERIAAIAAQTEDVVSWADVVRSGGSEHHVATRTGQRRWRTLQHEVYLLGAAPPTWSQRLRAAVLACGPGGCASHGSGLRNHGVDVGDDHDDDIWVTMPQSQRPEPRDVKVFRSRRPLTGTRVLNGIRTASVERCLLDFAAIADEETAENAVESALDQKKTTEDRIWETIVREGGRGVPGSRRLRRVMLQRPDGLPAKSVLETRMTRVLRQAGLGHFVRNLKVNDQGEKVDAGFVTERVAVEADSRQFHRTRTQRAKDKHRQMRIEAQGWFFVRATFEEVYLHPVEFVARVRAALNGNRQAA